MKASAGVEAFLDFLREAQSQYNIALSSERDADNMTQDVLHSLELYDNNYHDCARLALALRQVRQDRRTAKDTVLHYQPIVDWSVQNVKTIKELERLLGAVRKAEKNTEGRYYAPKTNILEELK